MNYRYYCPPFAYNAINDLELKWWMNEALGRVEVWLFMISKTFLVEEEFQPSWTPDNPDIILLETVLTYTMLEIEIEVIVRSMSIEYLEKSSPFN